MTPLTRLDATGAPAVASSAGLLVGWLVSGIAYASGPLSDPMCALTWIAVGAGMAYSLYRRMTSQYADWTDRRLVHTRLGSWIVTVGALLLILTVLRIVFGLGNDDELGLMLWGFAPL